MEIKDGLCLNDELVMFGVNNVPSEMESIPVTIRNTKFIIEHDIKIKVDEGILLPSFSKPEDTGFDIRVSQDTLIKPGETVQVPTGLRFQLPRNIGFNVRNRSGILSKTKLRVSGTVDWQYTGEVKILTDNIKFPIYNIKQGSFGAELVIKTSNKVLLLTGETIEIEQEVPIGTYLVKKGDRLAQGVFEQIIRANFSETQELIQTDRGDNGFGSSGIK